jgi:hypothetical protein
MSLQKNINVKKKSKPKNKVKVGNNKKIKKGVNSKILIVLLFFSGILLAVSTYAWLSASLNVRVKFFELTVDSDSGIFISLDGIDFSSYIEVSYDSVIRELTPRYPNHANQWSYSMWPVSSNGIKDSNSNRFAVYAGEVNKQKGAPIKGKKFLNTILVNEDRPNGSNVYLAFDLFLKNVTASPHTDNLYFDEEDTAIDFDYDRIIGNEIYSKEEIIEAMHGIMNSLRLGILKMGSVPLKSDVRSIQNIGCNNICQAVIYEPNSTSHAPISIENASEFGITLIDGQYVPTYGVINEGKKLEHFNGQEGTGYPLDTEHFALQNTITSFEKPIFAIPSGITKLRVYVWIEGQDVDSLETNSRGAAITINLGLRKDLAGYNED